MRESTGIICALLCLGFVGCQSNPGAGFKVPSEEASRTNPLGNNSDSIDKGKLLYHSSDCAMCHGKDGNGRGVSAKDIRMNTHDWRDPHALKDFSDGDLFYILNKGKGQMPGYERRQTTEQSWRMVSYVRSLAIRGTSAEPQKESEQASK